MPAGVAGDDESAAASGAGPRLILAGMTHLQLTVYAARDWRANFFPVGIAHSIVGGTAPERTPRQAVQRAGWQALRRYRAGLRVRHGPLTAHCCLGLAKLSRRTDKREQAQEHLATATTMYREMGMTYWLEKAEAEVREP